MLNRTSVDRTRGAAAISALPDEALITRRELSVLTSYSPQTLANWGAIGMGPEMTRVHGAAPRYAMHAVRAWLKGGCVNAATIVERVA